MQVLQESQALSHRLHLYSKVHKSLQYVITYNTTNCGQNMFESTLIQNSLDKNLHTDANVHVTVITASMRDTGMNFQ